MKLIKDATGAPKPYLQYQYDIDPVIKSYEHANSDTPENRANKKIV